MPGEVSWSVRFPAATMQFGSPISTVEADRRAAVGKVPVLLGLAGFFTALACELVRHAESLIVYGYKLRPRKASATNSHEAVAVDVTPDILAVAIHIDTIISFKHSFDDYQYSRRKITESPSSEQISEDQYGRRETEACTLISVK